MTDFSALFEPNYTILTFLMIKTFFYIEAIGALGVIRALSAAKTSRVFASLTVLVALIAIAAKYVPALAGLTDTDPARYADWITKAGVLGTGDGMAVPLGVTLLFGISALAPGRRWWLLDALFILCALGFFGLYAYTLL